MVPHARAMAMALAVLVGIASPQAVMVRLGGRMRGQKSTPSRMSWDIVDLTGVVKAWGRCYDRKEYPELLHIRHF
jgi:hypothetical protein